MLVLPQWSAFLLLALLTPPSMPPVPTEVLPDFSGACQFGLMKQEGNVLMVEGLNWSAVGLVRREVVIVWWTYRSSGRRGTSTYRLENGNLVGLWGWNSDVWIGTDDWLQGGASHETLWMEK